MAPPCPGTETGGAILTERTGLYQKNHYFFFNSIVISPPSAGAVVMVVVGVMVTLVAMTVGLMVMLVPAMVMMVVLVLVLVRVLGSCFVAVEPGHIVIVVLERLCKLDVEIASVDAMLVYACNGNLKAVDW